MGEQAILDKVEGRSLSCLRESSVKWFSSENDIDLVALISSSKSFC